MSRAMEGAGARGRLLGWAFLGVVAFLLAVVPAASGQEVCDGLVTEEDGRGALAGVRAGDEILSWRQVEAADPAAPGAAGRFCSGFDWLALRRRVAGRAGVELAGRRGGNAWSLRPGAGRWRARVRPALPAARLALYREGVDRFSAGREAAGLAAWERLRAAAPELGAWLALAGEDRARTADGRRLALAALRRELERAGSAAVEGELWEAMGTLHFRAGALPEAREAMGRALAARRGAGDPAAVVHSLYQLGRVAVERGDLELAGTSYGEALALARLHIPDSLPLSEILNGLAQVRAAAGETRAAQELYREALALARRLEPDGEAIPGLLNNLGILAVWRGDLVAAEDSYEGALRALAARPDDNLLARVLTNLGELAYRRGDDDRATAHWERALALKEKIDPGSAFTLSTVANLGHVALERGDLAAAERRFRQGRAIAARRLPGTLQEAGAERDLGSLAMRRGDFAGARARYRAALALERRLAPGGRDAARSHRGLAEVAAAQGRIEEAFAEYRQSLAIYRQIGPQGEEAAGVLAALGDLEVRRGRLAQAEAAYREATAALEAQLRTFGGTAELRAGYRDVFRDLYPRYVDLLLDLGRPEEALAVYERSRARVFLEMLGERDLALPELPPELEAERRQVGRRLDRAERELLAVDAVGQARRAEELRREITELRRRRDDLAAAARRAEPPAGPYDPEPLALGAIREALDPGTVLLAYSVGPARTNLLVVSREGGLRVERLAAGAAELEDGVRRLRTLLAEAAAAGPTQGERRRLSLAALERQLYAVLVAPAEADVEAARRVLIVPDGALHLLPFAALVRDGGAGGRGEYLIERRPLHFALSATLYARLRATPADAARPERRPGSLVAFGDPELPAALRARPPAAIGDPVLRSLLAGGFAFPPLPAAREEARGIAALFPGGRAFLGAEAREERAKALAPGASYLHFATHAVLDEAFPLESALVLSIPETLADDGDNGLLQVWEILEQVRLDADLVVLSGCETALGKRLSGEGLMGLTRAFHYAGARSVIASLWRISDASTAGLMTRLYGHLRDGLPPDEALRAAQVELLQGEAGEAATAPYFWAAFQLSGDWRAARREPR